MISINKKSLTTIEFASSLAAYFHDIGKANHNFIKKLRAEKTQENHRHEWVSFKIFEALVVDKTLDQWLSLLATPNQIDLNAIQKYLDNPKHLTSFKTQFKNYDDFTKLVAWLIVSHHKLLQYPSDLDFQPTLDFKMTEKVLDSCDVRWNTNFYQHANNEGTEKDFTFPHGLPFVSKTYQNGLSTTALGALDNIETLKAFKWEKDLFNQHLARLVLMLADRNYSAKEPTSIFQDPSYHCYANTYPNQKPKQKLDEHIVGVAYHAHQYAEQLPTFLDSLAKLPKNSVLESGPANGDKALNEWQDKAVNACLGADKDKGFFGINLASTGKGKTLANPRIMYALNKNNKARLSICLGLRTLTTQTGESLKSLLELNDVQITTLIGTKSLETTVDTSFMPNIDQDPNSVITLANNGSESLIDDNDFDTVVVNDSPLQNSLLQEWCGGRDKYIDLLKSPLLISTIDFLMPAVESHRAGRQIAPMLRLMSSDLIIDEPDEFGLDDIPALLRLVNFAGMLGCRVLLSSATISYALAGGLFIAYKRGRAVYERNYLGREMTDITCGWFSETLAQVHSIFDENTYLKHHHKFVSDHFTNLDNAVSNPKELYIRVSEIVPMSEQGTHVESMAETIYQAIHKAHNNHHETADGKSISVGVVRFANINPLVAVAKALFAKDAQEGVAIHYCVYHSQFSIDARSRIEKNLDTTLNRKNNQPLISKALIADKIAKHPEYQNHIFVVLATSVCEVGRDHDYDWAIAELSSLRSIVQLAGRVQRHRNQPVETPNIFVLDKNFKALQGKDIVFTKPGYETKGLKIRGEHTAERAFNTVKFKNVTPYYCVSNVHVNPNSNHDLATLEIAALWFRIFGIYTGYTKEVAKANSYKQPDNAILWITNQLTFTSELQRQQPFRKANERKYVFQQAKDNFGNLVWLQHNPYDYNKLIPTNNIQESDELVFGEGSFLWFDTSISESTLNTLYAEVEISYFGNLFKVCYYNDILGVYREID